MLSSGEKEALQNLKRYLDEGRDTINERYDGHSRLDIETLTVLKLVEKFDKAHASNSAPVAQDPPICIGQSRVLCDDVQRLLAYRKVVPRPVMIDYMKTIFGLHTALYTLRLSRQLAGWLRDHRAHPKCRECPVHGDQPTPFEGCPYQQSFTVDMGGDYHSRMAQLAQESASAEYGQLIDLIKSLFSMNQLMRFAKFNGLDSDPWKVPELLESGGAALDQFFALHLGQLREDNESDGQTLTADEESIYSLDLPRFDIFIELITHVRQKHHIKYLTEFMDKLLLKNTENGALVQGKTSKNLRRWHIGGRLLEVFVQLAVVRWRQDGPRKSFSTEPMLIEEFLIWLEERYGFVIGTPTLDQGRRPMTLEEHRAYRENVRALKDRLREIGFYDDLSDAYNAQTIQARYRLDHTLEGESAS
jgi:hypothetical protein